MKLSLLSTGIYSIPEAARLVQVHPARLRAWVCNRSNAKRRPLIRLDLPAANHQIALSFINLIEARFIAEFAKHGVHVLSIRCMAEEAERFLNHPHPFATDMLFRTDGRKIFVETHKRTRDPKLYDLKGHNWAMHPILSDALLKGVEFHADVASAWFPRKDTAPEVKVNPKVAFGLPALRKSGVPTEALYDALNAEDGDAVSVARWFDVPRTQVIQAAKFEADIRVTH